MPVNVIKITSDEDRQKAFEIRQKVFVEEQCVDPELEYDQFEESSTHYLAKLDGAAVGTARWRHTDKGIKLERFAVLSEHRDKGVGKKLLESVLADVIKERASLIYLHAQMQVIPFYEKFNFVPGGDIFEEAGIQHRVMKMRQ
jgi:predicted GNAT family N-acyltransferase